MGKFFALLKREFEDIKKDPNLIAPLLIILGVIVLAVGLIADSPKIFFTGLGMVVLSAVWIWTD